MDVVERVILVVFAAAVGEAVCEFLFMPIVDKMQKMGWIDADVTLLVQQWWSALVGVGIAYEMALDVFGLLGAAPRHDTVGWMLTGVLLGRGSNFVHDLLKRFSLGNELRQLEKSNYEVEGC